MSKLHNFMIADPDQVSSNDQLRSEFVRKLVKRPCGQLKSAADQTVPRILVQFWDNLNAIPQDVAECLATWSSVEELGIERFLFDDTSAHRFISEHLDQRHQTAFEKCSHPAMRSDYFRLCFIAVNGGLYVDADDELSEAGIPDLWNNSLMKVQPLCYEISSDSMVNPFKVASDRNDDLIFYVNNNPIYAPANHPVIKCALEQATHRLSETDGTSRDIQNLTGPGNLTEALVRHTVGRRQASDLDDFELLKHWDDVAPSKWPLEYRSGTRNWRLWIREGDQQ